MIRAGVRATLGQLPDTTVVAEASTGEEALQAVIRERPDLLILDLQMPGLSAHETICEGRAAVPQLKILVLSAHLNLEFLARLEAGQIQGYVLKHEAGTGLLQAVQTLRDGATWFSEPVMRTLFSGEAQSDYQLARQLNPREREILLLLAEGDTNPQIGRKLHLATQTVRNYVSLLYEKLAVKNRVDAAHWARRWLQEMETTG